MALDQEDPDSWRETSTDDVGAFRPASAERQPIVSPGMAPYVYYLGTLPEGLPHQAAAMIQAWLWRIREQPKRHRFAQHRQYVYDQLRNDLLKAETESRSGLCRRGEFAVALCRDVNEKYFFDNFDLCLSFLRLIKKSFVKLGFLL